MRRGGFTLIELLIVIGIITILAGALAPMFLRAQNKARIGRADADCASIKTAAVMLHHDTVAWPPIGNNGNGLINSTGLAAAAIALWDGPYLEAWDRDAWGNYYDIYDVVTGTVTARWVRSRGGDGAIGGGDDRTKRITPDITY